MLITTLQQVTKQEQNWGAREGNFGQPGAAGGAFWDPKPEKTAPAEILDNAAAQKESAIVKEFIEKEELEYLKIVDVLFPILKRIQTNEGWSKVAVRNGSPFFLFHFSNGDSIELRLENTAGAVLLNRTPDKAKLTTEDPNRERMLIAFTKLNKKNGFFQLTIGSETFPISTDKELQTAKEKLLELLK